MTDVLNKNALRTAPHSGEGQQIAFTTVSGSAGTALDTDLPGNFVTVINLGAGKARVLFGPSTVTVDFATTSGAELGRELAMGESEDWLLDPKDSHIAVEGDGAGNLQIWKSSGPLGRVGA